MKKIAVFIANYTIGNSPSIINLLDLLSDNYKVDIYLQSVSLKNATVFKKKNINIIDLDGRHRSIRYIRYIKKMIKSHFIRYKHYICIDPHGFVLCKKFFPNSKPIYYSLELYMKDDHFGLYYPKYIFRKERKKIDEIKGLIIQSEEREALFRKDYNLTNQVPVLLLPVTNKGLSINEKSTFIRKKYDINYDINNNKKIALHLGGIAEWFSCIELALTFSRLEKWILFFQGYADEKYLERFNNILIEQNIRNVILSDELYDSIEDVDNAVRSCDIGIAWYNDLSANFRTFGKSSGKIATYLRFGLPVIAKKYPSITKVIEDMNCGICVDSFDMIPGAVSEIEKCYDKYSMNALAEYDKIYRFENYENKIIEFIEL